MRFIIATALGIFFIILAIICVWTKASEFDIKSSVILANIWIAASYILGEIKNKSKL